MWLEMYGCAQRDTIQWWNQNLHISSVYVRCCMLTVWCRYIGQRVTINYPPWWAHMHCFLSVSLSGRLAESSSKAVPAVFQSTIEGGFSILQSHIQILAPWSCCRTMIVGLMHWYKNSFFISEISFRSPVVALSPLNWAVNEVSRPDGHPRRVFPTSEFY